MYENERSESCRLCDKKAVTRGLCPMHYTRLWRAKVIGGNNRNDSRESKKRALTVWHNIDSRCNEPTTNEYERYGGRGIKNLITVLEIETLWIRDGASSMKKPSIDRRDNDGHYTFENCRFIEFTQNIALRQIVRKLCKRCNIATPRNRKRICDTCNDTRTCKCGKIFVLKRKRTCDDCRIQTRSCAFCEKAITRDSSKTGTATFRNKLWFCSKREQGLWLATNFGFGSESGGSHINRPT